MKIELTTILIVIVILVAIIIGGYLLVAPQNLETMTTQREVNEITNEEVKGELEEKIDVDLQEQELEFTKKIDEYISSIYYGTDTWINEFDNINLADENWIWECAYTNLHKREDLLPATIIKKDIIEESAKEVFGYNLTKEFPKEGLEFWLEPEEDGYFYTAASVEHDFWNNYELISYEKNNNIIIANIVEYKYNEIFLGDPTEFNLYKINSEEIVKSYSLNTSVANDNYNDFLLKKHEEAKTFVKDNAEMFSTATVTLEYDEETELMYIKSFER